MFKIRRCINETAAKAMVHTMITSKLDYCHAILYDLPELTLKHLTRVHVHVVSQRGKYELITPVLKQLHWLPIRQRIHYKVLISLNGLAPTYLEELRKRRPMKTRADGNIDLLIPAIKHKFFGGRSLGYGGPKLWNEYFTKRTEAIHVDPPLSILFADMRVPMITRDCDVDHVVEKKNRMLLLRLIHKFDIGLTKLVYSSQMQTAAG